MMVRILMQSDASYLKDEMRNSLRVYPGSFSSFAVAYPILSAHLQKIARQTHLDADIPVAERKSLVGA